MKETLQVNGREITFTEKEHGSILEKHFSDKEIEQDKAAEIAQVPKEGKWFKVNPLAIDENLFKKERRDSKQEETRQLILEAFEEMKKDSKYAKPFKTMMPEKTGTSKTVSELKEMAKELGDHNADWVEQSLEWAQRIANGETWESICNDRDTANWYRIVVWKNGYCRLVGGSRKNNSNNPASGVSFFNCSDADNYVYTVPLVVLYE